MKQEKVTFIHSISAKITLLAVFIVVVSLVGSVINASSKSRKVVENVNSNYILSLAEMGAQTIGNIPADIATDEEYSKIISEINMTGVESAYAYLVSEDGTMIYHPTADKIGQPVENTVVKEVVSQLASGTVPEDAVVEYEFNGGIKYAGYALTPDHMIVVVTADKDEIVKPVNQMIWFMSITAGITLVVCVIIGYLLSRFICTPLEHLTEIIKNTADLNFSHNAKSDGLCKRTDETGFMARELRAMRRNLREMVANIDTASQQITGNVDGLKQVTETVDHMCSDNSATSQQLAAGMQETAATTVNINENVGTMKEEADRLTEMAEKGADVSNEVMDRAKNLCNKTVTASNRTMEMYTNVKEKSEKAIEGSKAVEKINELTNTIMEISSQTGLLALNASIEAARAGEAGKGFSVVATEISKLAQNTASSVEEISQLIDQVDGLVDDAVNQANVSVQNIGESGGRIRVAQETFEQIYTCIEDMKNGINNMITQIAAVNNVAMDVSAISEEQAASTTVISETSDAMVGQANNLAGQSEQVADSSKVLTNTSEQLAEQMGRFQI